jgi:hypothetical protein
VSKSLSATMVACLDIAQEAGGELVRYQGGYWADRGGGHPVGVNRRECHSTPTVQALVRRGFAEYSEYRDGRSGLFPIAMRLIPLETTVEVAAAA